MATTKSAFGVLVGGCTSAAMGPLGEAILERQVNFSSDVYMFQVCNQECHISIWDIRHRSCFYEAVSLSLYLRIKPGEDSLCLCDIFHEHR